jgi:predicted glycoside hydrolase/deacetylase ChbG (UPF0249 family)
MAAAAATRRWVALHADDFGMSRVVNAGILRSFREGLLTSTSLLANAPGAEEACALWPKLSEELQAGSLPSSARRRKLNDPLQPFDLGIHINLTQGSPLSKSYPAELLNDHGQFPGIGPVFRQLRSTGTKYRDGVRKELQQQVERMLDLGVTPTHLNGHQYIEMIPGVAEVIPELMSDYAIPIVRIARESHLVRTVLRQGRLTAFAVALIKRYYAGRFASQPAVLNLASPAHFFGTSHAGLVDRVTLKRFLEHSSLIGGTEIGLHPAILPGADARPASDEWFDPLQHLRPLELNWLCDPATDDLFMAQGTSLGRLSQLLQK